MATNATADVLMLFISYCSRVCINTRSFPLRSFSKWHSCHLQQSPVLPLWWLGGMSLRHLLLAINNWWRCHWYNGRRQVQQSVGECCKAAGPDWLSPRVLGTSTDELICCFPVVSFFFFFFYVRWYDSQASWRGSRVQIPPCLWCVEQAPDVSSPVRLPRECRGVYNERIKPQEMFPRWENEEMFFSPAAQYWQHD